MKYVGIGIVVIIIFSVIGWQNIIWLVGAGIIGGIGFGIYKIKESADMRKYEKEIANNKAEHAKLTDNFIRWTENGFPQVAISFLKDRFGFDEREQFEFDPISSILFIEGDVEVKPLIDIPSFKTDNKVRMLKDITVYVYILTSDYLYFLYSNHDYLEALEMYKETETPDVSAIFDSSQTANSQYKLDLSLMKFTSENNGVAYFDTPEREKGFSIEMKSNDFLKLYPSDDKAKSIVRELEKILIQQEEG